MLNGEPGKWAGCTGQPLTHRDCLAHAPRGAMLLGIGRPLVQVRRSHPGGAYTLCGQVSELLNNGETGAEWFKVETCIGTVWAQGKALRMCSGDGRCTCEPALGQPDGATSPAPMGGPGSTGGETIEINRSAASATLGRADV